MTEQEKRGFKNLAFDILQTLVLALAIFMIVYLFLFQPHQVKGESMFPTLENSEYLLTEKISYRFGQPERGDIIVFESPPNPSEDFIKRIVALPGEEVKISQGHVVVNGKPLEENYLPENTYTSEGTFNRVSLGDDEYFVLGDNRNNSSDSRRWGPVKRKAVVGKSWIIYWPLNKFASTP